MFALLKNCPWHAHFLRCLFQFFNIRNFQIFRITKFASQIVFYFVLIVSSVKYQSFRLFLCEGWEHLRVFFSQFWLQILNLPALISKNICTAYDRFHDDCFHGNGPSGKIPTKKEPIRTPGLILRPSCHIIKWRTLHGRVFFFECSKRVFKIFYSTRKKFRIYKRPRNVLFIM